MGILKEIRFSQYDDAVLLSCLTAFTSSKIEKVGYDFQSTYSLLQSTRVIFIRIHAGSIEYFLFLFLIDWNPESVIFKELVFEENHVPNGEGLAFIRMRYS